MQIRDLRMGEDAERIIDIYDRNAAFFDKDRLRILFERSWLDRFLALVPIGGSILDIGCGTAEPIGRYLIEAGRKLTGIDSSPAMIDFCKSRFPNHVWIVADMRTLSVPKRFDGLIAWDSFFHLTHDAQRKMFPIFSAHAASNAALMFTSGPSHSESIGRYRGEPLYHSSLDEAEYHSLLSHNGFDVVAHVANDPECDRHTVWLARLR
jgi:SAM-dependent methyltransferase